MPKKSEDIFDLEISRIDVPDRVRETFVDMESLRVSMDRMGLLQPILVHKKEGGRYDLIAGGRRLKTAISLEWDVIKSTVKENLTPDEALEQELEENIQRVDIPWQEEDEGIRQLHRLKKNKFNSLRTYPGTWTQQRTADALGRSAGKISEAIELAEAAETYPEVSVCKNRKEARRLFLKIKRGQFMVRDSDFIMKLKESFIYELPESLLPTLDSEIADCIITDLEEFPMESIVQELFRILKLTGHAWIFCSYEDQIMIRGWISQLTNNYSKTPFIWHIRGEDRFRMFFWFSKNISEPPRDIKKLMAHNPVKDAFNFLEKPRSLLEQLILRCTHKGQYILDPLCYGTNFALQCMEQGRSWYAACPTKILYDKLIKREEKSDSKKAAN
tara:strand:- start:11633 stop:12793 length:1161 start_codon:yes stop_codon:yes gene_type:complete